MIRPACSQGVVDGGQDTFNFQQANSIQAQVSAATILGLRRQFCRVRRFLRDLA